MNCRHLNYLTLIRQITFTVVTDVNFLQECFWPFHNPSSNVKHYLTAVYSTSDSPCRTFFIKLYNLTTREELWVRSHKLVQIKVPGCLLELNGKQRQNLLLITRIRESSLSLLKMNSQ